MKTEHAAALRAGQGMLLSSDARNGASGSQLDSKEAQSQIERSHELQLSMAGTAQKHNAGLKDDKGRAGTGPIAGDRPDGQQRRGAQGYGRRRRARNHAHTILLKRVK
ncbi:type VI secretion system Vgr family protein [Janthinobacterium sp. CG_23.3]|uniref:type VI secretion system Vgr family protein n=1 Tax=Janthinobacterium sp. CG_23.3 TaxID=3349634 RepID=UPI0038D488EE